MKAGFSSRRATDDVLLLVLFFAALVLLHSPLLRLPYFWDEAGYYIPAARDILLTGSLIPSSTVSNAHPPLLLAYLALAWKLFGYTPLVTRCAMLLVSAFCLLGVFRLARRVGNTEVAIGSVITLSLYPVYFAQSSLAHMDLGAAAFVIWGIDSYFANRRWTAVAFFAFATLTKETAIIVPAALCAWELLLRLPVLRRTTTWDIPGDAHGAPARRESWQTIFSLLVASVPLIGWFAFHYVRTGHVFGNPDFFRYNLGDTLHPVRILAALVLRLWHLFGYMSMALLTAAVLLAITLKPRPIDNRHAPNGNGARPRIALRTQLAFCLVILFHVIAFAVLGGAVLARYLLPVYPLVIIVGVSTLRRRLPWWPAFLAVICFAFVIALITEPPYRFAPEDNLAYSDYVRLHQSADRFLLDHFPSSTVLTAWPASDELTRPWLGYVDKPVRILSIENFSVEQLLSAADVRGQYQVALLFSTKEEPRLLLNFAWWERLQARYFGYHRDLRPAEAAQLLRGRVVYAQHRGSQWVAVVSLETIENAELRPSSIQ
jgi:4-amino-4-deoxy-L-arabinose transferase-like glycosyltransferase